MAAWKSTASRFLDEHGGASSVEYAVMVALIVAAVVGVLGQLGLGIEQTSQAVVQALVRGPRPGGGPM
jgi:Flp pilus assembly pilin Flp